MDGSSSSKTAGECFRLYCKGLISEEVVVNNVKVTVGGIGVAICEPTHNNLIFKASNSLEVLIDDSQRTMSSTTTEAAELSALIQGLTNALTLDLKDVTFFCHDNNIYQYVTNKVIPENSKIATLVNQVIILQGKFESCHPSFAELDDIKFALKFARDAIISQITGQPETSNGKSLKETCGICLEETVAAQMFSIEGCLHRYCISCMKQHVEVKLLSGTVALCPHGGCKSEVNIDSFKMLFSPKLVKVVTQRIKESSIHVTDRVYCQHPKCSAVMSKNEVLEYTKTYYAGVDPSGARKCMKCHYYFCINCMVPWHFGMTCDEYKMSHTYPSKEDELLNSLATTKGWRKCTKCKHMVELAEGCYHIKCRCGYEFCYSCGAEWKNTIPPTCRCELFNITPRQQARCRIRCGDIGHIVAAVTFCLIFLVPIVLMCFFKGYFN